MTTVTTTHVLESTPPHYAWDNPLSPDFSIHSGDVVTFETRDASDGQFRADSTPLGELSTMPPRRTGGDVDIRQLVAGSTLFLPRRSGGRTLLSRRCAQHQGDGEVCVSAIEMASTVRLRFHRQTRSVHPEPQFRTPGNRLRHSSGSTYVTTAHGPDLMANSRQAVRYMLDHLEHEYGLSREDAYCLASVAIDLKISEIVDAPDWGRE